MENKEVLATLQIANTEVRFVLAEFHNGKLNILHVARQKHQGMKLGKITSESAISKAIKQILERTKAVMGFQVVSVLLVVPNYDFTLVSKRVTLVDNETSTLVEDQKLKEAYLKAISEPAPENLIFVNGAISRFNVDGIYLRKIPANQKVNYASIDLDLLYASKEEIFKTVNAVEAAGLAVIEIGLSSYALGFEMSLLRQSQGSYQLVIEMERDITALSLYHHGRLINVASFIKGLNYIFEKAVYQFQLSYGVISKLCKHHLDLSQEPTSEEIIYLWNKDEQTLSLTNQQLYQAVILPLKKYLDELALASLEITSLDEVNIFVSGEGAQLYNIADLVTTAFKHPSKIYVPTTLGARDSSLAVSLGMFYLYKDSVLSLNSKQNSVNISEYQSAVNVALDISDDLSDSFTSRFKEFFSRGFK